MKKIQPRIIVSHEYVSLVLNKRRLTCSYGGVKAGSGIPDAVFNKWSKALFNFDPDTLKELGINPEGAKVLPIIEAFAKNIDTIWPEWNAEIILPKVDETVKVNMGKRRGIVEAKVMGVRTNYVNCLFADGKRIGIHFDMIVK
ncbi:MAG: hypothetical protein M0R48_10985 [Candidatus Omnitrophica bacterium]|nr:hypothetical protein [Candidatus Omnitrophota bacterium]